MIDYYTAFLGMKDTITEDDLLLDDERATTVERDEVACDARSSFAKH